MSDTPRTDAVRGTTELREHAEQLERELMDAQASIRELSRQVDRLETQFLEDDE